MAFDLFITFAGLCLFQRPKEGGEELKVFLPPTQGHEHCCKDASDPTSESTVPGHFARLGYHVRYDPTLTGGPGKRFQEFEFAGKHLDLGSIGGRPKTLNREFRQLDVVDITDVVTEPLCPDRAIGGATIRSGSLCPGAVCEHSRGARWEIPGKKPTQHMATLVTWRIRDVKKVMEGGEGLELVVTDLKGRNPERCAVLRPVDGQIRIYLFHTPHDELPSQGVPPFQTWNSKGPNGERATEADHFRAYYSLFPGHDGDEVPEFVDEGEEDEDGDEPEGSEEGLGVASRKFHQVGRFGRRYNCILTVVDDGGEG